MTDIFSTQIVNGVVQSLLAPPSALLDRYFPTTKTADTELITFDVVKGARRVSPFVHPLVKGSMVEGLGSAANTFKPAYVKDWRRFDPTRGLKRTVGEPIGGNLSPQQRIQRLLVQELEDQLGMLTRRQEIMASEAIRLGQITVTGEDYPTVVVDFARSANLTVAALAGGAAWDQTTATPLDNLVDWQLLVVKEVGAGANDVIMGVDAWKAFRSNAGVSDRLKQFAITNAALGPQPTMSEGLTYMGQIDGFNIYVYAGWYVDPITGTVTEIWPADQVAIVSGAIEGVRNYGAILDVDALQAVPYFAKSWVEQNPSARFLMLQSAPLPTPYRPDAAICVDVL